MSSNTSQVKIKKSDSFYEVNDLDEIQDIIDISADRLEKLRTQCSTSATFIQQEIRSLEAKLLGMFSDLLLKKARLNERVPSNGLSHTNTELKQWLRVVGLSPESVNVCLTSISTLEQLIDQNDEELKLLLTRNPNFRDEEVRRLTKAMFNLKLYIEFLNNGGMTNMINTNIEEEKETKVENEKVLTAQLFWDSWDRHHFHRTSIGNIGGGTCSPRNCRNMNKQNKINHQSGCSKYSPAHDLNTKSSTITESCCSNQESKLSITLIPSPPDSPLSSLNDMYAVVRGSTVESLDGTHQRTKFVGTPPPLIKHQTQVPSVSMTPPHLPRVLSQNFIDYSFNVKDNYNDHSKYQQDKCNLQNNSVTLPSAQKTTKQGLTDLSTDTYSIGSSELFLENNNNANNSFHIPRSPGNPVVKVGMTHNVKHRFNKVIKIRSNCDFCKKPMYIGLKCKECKYKCHNDCETNVPPSCGLPKEYVNTFKNLIEPNLTDQISFPLISGTVFKHNNQIHGSSGSVTFTSPSLNHRNQQSFPKHNKPDSSSPGSSCNSSSPSSPALFNLQHHGSQQSGNSTSGGNGLILNGKIISSSGCPSSSNSLNHLSTPSSQKQGSQFKFPEVTVISNIDRNILPGQNIYSSQRIINNDEQNEISSALKLPNSIILVPHQNSINPITTSTSKFSSTNINCSSSFNGNETVRTNVSSSQTVSSSLINSSTPITFYQRKLSSAGVDKRPVLNSEFFITHKSNDSEKTISTSGSNSASTDSDRTPIRLDSTEDGDSVNWPRQNSLSLKEWDIPYNDLTIKEKIGKGRFGTVHRALWHGDVAVKLLKKDYLDDECMLEAFKLEVANFKKTRHENLVLFMGACMNPPYLAIVTSLCKGNTLYTYIHQRHEKFTINKTTLVAQQISQGMGYLHARGIYHKDLRTKNIFLENGKVIITDFGLFSSTKLLYFDIGLGVPSGWLCYLAPELMRALMPVKPRQEILPFSKSSDVYSFGTVWYELLCGEFPFRTQPHESIIWQVGRGMKQTLANLQTSRDVKDILMMCWSFTKEDRPDFSKLLILLERLPKKRLARSPSHPVQLSRSAESVF